LDGFVVMAFEIDHLFILTDIGAYAAERLVSFGLLEGTSNMHPGQGTTNRRFFFHSAMLELLWVHDPEEVQSELIRPTRLWERWKNRANGSCPFGICLRPTLDSDETVAFSSWAYRPPYLPQTMSIEVGKNSPILTEPWLFQTPFGQRPDQYPVEKLQPLDHATGFREITRVELVGPATNPMSPELRAVVNTKQVQFREGAEYCMELGFDGEVQGKQVDFRPGLPLVIGW
jgi:hypothetical protein